MRISYRPHLLSIVTAMSLMACNIDTSTSSETDEESGSLTSALSTVGGTADIIIPKYQPDPSWPYPISIDGRVDYDWRYGDFVQVAKKTALGAPNNAVFFASKWDSQYLYLAIKVREGYHPYNNYLFDDSASAWEDDAIEIFIDPQNNKSATYDSRDRQLIISYKPHDRAPEIWTSGAIAGLQFGQAYLMDLKYLVGYVAEIAIPWSSLGVAPGHGTRLGIDVAVDDDDNGGARDGQQVWFGNADNFRSTSAWGTAALYDGAAVTGPVARKLATPPFIDGALYDWRISDFTLENRLNRTVVGSTNNAATFTANWDDTYLYLLAKTDEGLQGPAPYDTLHADSANIWEDDALEIFIDPQNNKSTSFDALDRQLLIGYQEFDQPPRLVVNGGALPGLIFKTEPNTHYQDKYIYGFKVMTAIPWTSLGVTPQPGLVIGLDVANDDDDNAGGREGQVVWNGTANNYRDPSAWGSITLVE